MSLWKFALIYYSLLILINLSNLFKAFPLTKFFLAILMPSFKVLALFAITKQADVFINTVSLKKWLTFLFLNKFNISLALYFTLLPLILFSEDFLKPNFSGSIVNFFNLLFFNSIA